MPKIRRQKVPPAVLAHIIRRVRERQITAEQLAAFSDWLAINPEVPEGKWFKKFAGFTICAEGELVKTVLLPGQLKNGVELE